MEHGITSVEITVDIFAIPESRAITYSINYEKKNIF